MLVPSLIPASDFHEISDPPSMQLSVIVPARNEEDCVGECLRSLAGQSDAVFKLGVDWEILVVDDGSADRTRGIAEAVEGVMVMDAAPLPKNWTGKANAVWTAAKQARGEW